MHDRSKTSKMCQRLYRIQEPINRSPLGYAKLVTIRSRELSDTPVRHYHSLHIRALRSFIFQRVEVARGSCSYYGHAAGETFGQRHVKITDQFWLQFVYDMGEFGFEKLRNCTQKIKNILKWIGINNCSIPVL